MSGSRLIKDNSCILKDVDGDKFTSGVVFGLASEVLQDFELISSGQWIYHQNLRLRKNPLASYGHTLP